MPKLALVACLLLVWLPGCGGPNPLPTASEADDNLLLQVGEMYRSYQTVKSRPATKLADLSSLRAVSGNAYQAVQKGDIVLRYGATMTGLQEEPGPPTSDEVLAYFKAVPESGGKVLMLDRNVKTMTAEEFKAAKKAGKD